MQPGAAARAGEASTAASRSSARVLASEAIVGRPPPRRRREFPRSRPARRRRSRPRSRRRRAGRARGRSPPSRRRERDARRLLAVPQRRVENRDPAAIGHFCSSLAVAPRAYRWCPSVDVCAGGRVGDESPQRGRMRSSSMPMPQGATPTASAFTGCAYVQAARHRKSHSLLTQALPVKPHWGERSCGRQPGTRNSKGVTLCGDDRASERHRHLPLHGHRGLDAAREATRTGIRARGLGAPADRSRRRCCS